MILLHGITDGEVAAILGVLILAFLSTTALFIFYMYKTVQFYTKHKAALAAGNLDEAKRLQRKFQFSIAFMFIFLVVLALVNLFY